MNTQEERDWAAKALHKLGYRGPLGQDVPVGMLAKDAAKGAEMLKSFEKTGCACGGCPGRDECDGQS